MLKTEHNLGVLIPYLLSTHGLCSSDDGSWILQNMMNAYLQKSEDYESKGFMDAVRITDFPIRDHKVILVLRRRRWRNKETGETFVDRISVTESGTRYSKEFAAFLKETYGHIPDDLPYA